VQEEKTYFKDRAKAKMIVFALVTTLAVAVGCGGMQQDPGEAKNTSEPYASSAPDTQQASPQDGRDQAPIERYEDLEMGESAEFENGLTATLEEASVMDVPESLSDLLEVNDLLVAVRFSVENANPEGQTSRRSFDVTTARWEALDQNGNPLQTLYPVETSLIVGELPNPDPDYPYMGWQGELRPGQKRQGSMLFAAPPSTKMRVRFTQPVMSAPFGEWELGRVSQLPRAP
jgi:hypothetical protein